MEETLRCIFLGAEKQMLPQGLGARESQHSLSIPYTNILPIYTLFALYPI